MKITKEMRERLSPKRLIATKHLPRKRLVEKHLCDECDDRFTCKAKEDCSKYNDFLTTDFSSKAVTEVYIKITDFLSPPEYDFEPLEMTKGWTLDLDDPLKEKIFYFKEEDYRLRIKFDSTTQILTWYTEKIRESSEKGEYPYYTDVIKGKIYVLRLDSGYWWSKDDKNGWLELFHETLKFIKQEKPSGIIIQDNSMPEWNMAEETHFSINEWFESKNEN